MVCSAFELVLSSQYVTLNDYIGIDFIFNCFPPFSFITSISL